jgi:thiamine biosynthesis lipoprotein ApbE
MVAKIRLRDRALGTSGSAVQFFRHRGKRYGHILDPLTGHPLAERAAYVDCSLRERMWCCEATIVPLRLG